MLRSVLTTVSAIIALAIFPVPAFASTHCKSYWTQGPAVSFATVKNTSCGQAHYVSLYYAEAGLVPDGWHAARKQVMPPGTEDPQMRVTMYHGRQLLVFYMHY